jgi:hypothetical protein
MVGSQPPGSLESLTPGSQLGSELCAVPFVSQVRQVPSGRIE